MSDDPASPLNYKFGVAPMSKFPRGPTRPMNIPRPDVPAFGKDDYWICCHRLHGPDIDIQCFEKNSNQDPKCKRKGCGHERCGICPNMGVLGSHMNRQGYKDWNKKYQGHGDGDEKKETAPQVSRDAQKDGAALKGAGEEANKEVEKEAEQEIEEEVKKAVEEEAEEEAKKVVEDEAQKKAQTEAEREAEKKTEEEDKNFWLGIWGGIERESEEQSVFKERPQFI